MAIQDLTPQLRTRLSRVERAVGWFVFVATALLLAGFVYYVYHTAQRKGWFLIKVPYHIFVRTAAGIQLGDRVKLLGFDAGEVTKVTAMPPFSDYGQVYIEFIVWEPYYGYIWDDSRVKITTADFLGKRSIELIQGGLSGRTNLHASYDIQNGIIQGVWNPKEGKYFPLTKDSKGYTMYDVDEAPALGDRFEKVAAQLEKALPNILNLTNQITAVLSNTINITAKADSLLTKAEPTVTNLALITGHLREPKGALGDWLIPTNIQAPLAETLTNAASTLRRADAAIYTVDTNVAVLSSNLNLTLIHLANLTSNLNAQVEMNTNILGVISATIKNADDMVQGLKRHWLLRSAFKEKATNTPAAKPLRPRGR